MFTLLLYQLDHIAQISVLDNLSDAVKNLIRLDRCHIIRRWDWLRLDLCLAIALDLFEFVYFLALNEIKRFSGTPARPVLPIRCT